MSKVKFDTSELYERIIVEYKSVDAFAKAVKMKAGTLTSRLEGRTYFYASEMERIIKALDLNPYAVKCYFFTPAKTA